MTYKCALVDIPCGGLSLIIDPNSYNKFDLERITRRFSQELIKRDMINPCKMYLLQIWEQEKEKWPGLLTNIED